MQVEASIGVIAGTTELALLDVEQVINAILQAVRETMNSAARIPLIP